MKILSVSHQYIQRYCWSIVSHEDTTRARMLLELLFQSGVFRFDRLVNIRLTLCCTSDSMQWRSQGGFECGGSPNGRNSKADVAGGLHSNSQSSCISVYTGLHLHTLLTSFVMVAHVEVRQRLRSSSSSSLIVSRTRLLTVGDRAFSGRRCTCLEQSARSCHFSTFCSSLPVPA